MGESKLKKGGQCGQHPCHQFSASGPPPPETGSRSFSFRNQLESDKTKPGQSSQFLPLSCWFKPKRESCYDLGRVTWGYMVNFAGDVSKNSKQESG